MVSLKSNNISVLTDSSDVKRQNQDEHVYTQLFDAILSQSLLPGTKLTEEELSSIFKVSRTVVRRALLRLSHDQIVIIQPNKGASVAKLTPKQATEILSARSLIELAIVEEAVRCIDSGKAAELKSIVQAEKQEFESDRRGSGIRLSGDFHLALVKMTGNSVLTKFLKELIPLTSLIIAQYEKPGCSTCSHQEHLDLIKVIESGDEAAATAMMSEHLQHIKDKLDLRTPESSADLRQVFKHIVDKQE